MSALNPRAIMLRVLLMLHLAFAPAVLAAAAEVGHGVHAAEFEPRGHADGERGREADVEPAEIGRAHV